MKAMKKKIIQLTIVLFAVTSMSMVQQPPAVDYLKNIPAERKFSLSIEGLTEKAEITLSDIDGQVLLNQKTEGQKNSPRYSASTNCPAVIASSL